MAHGPFKLKPICWTIAGSDSSGCAGIQADLKTFHNYGVHGCSVVTAITAQNSLTVSDIQPISLAPQLDALKADVLPDAIKIGMLGHPHDIEQLAQFLHSSSCPVIYDPVMRSSSNTCLMDEKMLHQVTQFLLPATSLLTPNLSEAEALTGINVKTPTDIEQAARHLLGLGPKAILIKGGHRGGPFKQDYYCSHDQSFWLTNNTVETLHCRGTGCTLSSAIAAGLALGFDLPDAIVFAQAYVHQGLRGGHATGQGPGTLSHQQFPDAPEDLPWLTQQAEAGLKRPQFAELDAEPLGVYPIAQRAVQVKELVEAGATTVQIRVKDLTGDALKQELKEAMAHTRNSACRLFINDHWEEALALQPYGVHLGQDDLDPMALDAISKAGLRLGLSTHSITEMARANAYRPSYIAIGTVYHTSSKVMDYEPLGLLRFQRLCQLSTAPVVAIGGLNLENAASIIKEGVIGIAVISALHNAKDKSQSIRDWKNLFRAAHS